MKKALLVALAALFLALALSGAAFAQTPQEIYDDYAFDRDLDGTYTGAQLQAYLDNALVHQYGDPAILTALDSAVRGILGGGERSSFPFTGAQVALLAAAAAVLIGGGIGIRKLASRVRS
ncbi:MAG: hypothetical protein JXA87_05290 [Thermoleophilia bacterium]|nr:hypothetical protein [Thermoleophilia bacterium]